MRRTVSVLSIVVGGALALLGVVAAVAIGPDDVATPPSTTTVSSDGTRAAVTAPDLFPYRNATIRITADNAGGAVFIGVANPVDAGSYLADVTRLRVTEVGRDGTLAGDTEAGSLTAPPVAPETTTFWDDSVSGRGQQRLDVPLTGDPVAIAVVAGPTGGTLTMSLGVVVPHGFLAAVATAVLGLALIALTVVLRRRGRPRPTSQVDVASPVPAGAAEPLPTGATWSRSARPRARARAGALGLVGATILAGCSGLPERVDTASVTPVRTALTDAEVMPAFASYDERNNAAIALSAQSYDPSGWAAADTGTALRADTFSTLLAQAKGDTQEPYTRTTSPLQVFVPAFESYPMWFMATASTTSTGTGVEPDDTVGLRVFERASVLEPWRLVTHNAIEKDAAPRPLRGGRASTATPAQLKVAADAMTAVRTFATTGDAGALGVDDSLTAFRSDITDVPAEVGTLTQFDVTPTGDPTDPTGPRGAVRVVRVEGGAVATIGFEYVHTVTAHPDETISLTNEAVAAVVGQTGSLDAITMHGVLSVAVLLPDDGPSTVLDAWYSTTTAP
jgi:hypothetical protein